MSELTDYVMSFYGPDGLCEDEFLEREVTPERIAYAVKALTGTVATFTGAVDSFDREMVRDFLMWCEGTDVATLEWGNAIAPAIAAIEERNLPKHTVVDFPTEACEAADPEGEYVDAMYVAQLADYAEFARPFVAAIAEIAEGLRTPEWSNGFIEHVATIVDDIADASALNYLDAEGQERQCDEYPDDRIVDGQDWDCR